jgi:hypothetical protein
MDGIHLPDRVGCGGPVVGASGLAAGGSRGLLLPPEPALQRPYAGEVGDFRLDLLEA